MKDNKLFAVAGSPVLHSLSPQIHRAGYKSLGINAWFTRLAVDNAEELILLADKLGMDGLCITAPFKEKVAEFIDDLTFEAKVIGSVNTIEKRDGKWVGHNTDHNGVVESLKSKGIDLTDKKCLIVGTGGASRAAAYGLVEAGAKVVLTGRNRMKSVDIASQMVCNIGDFNQIESHIKDAEIIVNTIPGECTVYKSTWFNESQVILDANYKNSTLKSISLEVGCEFVSGIDWLIYQAIPSFKLFTGKEVDPSVMFEAIEVKNHVNKQIVSLTGFFNSGKTSISRELSAMTNKPWLNLEDFIMQKTGLDVDRLIIEKGVSAYREMEKDYVMEISKAESVIADIGNGILYNPDCSTIIENDTIPVWLFVSMSNFMSRYFDNKEILEPQFNPDDAALMYYDSIDVYANSSELIIDTDERNIEQVSQKLYEEIHKAGIF
jgi:shikimate dehydrogenase